MLLLIKKVKNETIDVDGIIEIRTKYRGGNEAIETSKLLI